MIIRIVKMTFREEACDDFLDLFGSVNKKIASFPGCSGVELLRDINNRNIFFTYSKWESEKDLQNYRHSPLFKDTWKRTKALFEEKAAAWSVDHVNIP